MQKLDEIKKEMQALGMTTLDVEKKDWIATLTINKPEIMNALGGSPTYTAKEGDIYGPYDSYWRTLMQDLKYDPEVRVVIITGTGDRAFSAGANVKLWGAREAEIRRTGKRPKQGTVITEGTTRPYIWLRELQKPSIAAVNGLAVGMGADLAIACDMRIASEKAWFQWAYILRGMVPMDGGCWLLTRLVGPAKAMELMLTGDRVYADEALRLGIVNQVVPHEQLMDATMELAQKIAKGPWAAVQLARYTIYAGMTQSFTDNLSLSMMAANLERETIAEGMIARGLEKKDADFKGK
jgi:enoyl-CoA hydratase/carnithine racemase